MSNAFFSFDSAQFNRLFPYYILVDEKLFIHQYGQSFADTFTSIPPQAILSDYFSFPSLHEDEPTFQSLQEITDEPITLTYKQNAHIQLNGPIIVYGKQLIFAVSLCQISVEETKEQQLVEQKLEEQRKFYENVLNNIPADIVVFDNKHRYLFLNSVAIKDPVLRQWLVGKRDEDYCAYRNRPISIAEERRVLFNKVMQSKTLHSWEEKIVNQKGETEYHIRNMYPVLNEQGEVTVIIGYGLNITKRKLVEEQLAQKEKSYRDLFNYSQALICTHDLTGKILSVNPALCATLGYTEEEMVKQSLAAFIPEKDKEKFQPNYLDKILDGEKTNGLFRVVHKNGEKLFLLYQNYRVEEAGSPPYIIGFSQDISDRIKAEQELLLAKKMTEDAARAKEVFLANMSHEIRTPMHGILGIAGLLAKTTLDEKQKNYINLITESANNLVVIVNDILDIEKIASGKFEFEAVDFFIANKLNTTLQSFQYKAEEKGIQLILQNKLPAGLVIKGDPHRLGQILNNLLSNALKFTKQGSITVSSFIAGENENGLTIHFSVTDTGIGIPQDKLSVIFDPFVQASSDTTRKYGGTGLGLSICKNLVEMQGGHIEVSSHENKGTSFIFRLPYTRGSVTALEEIQPVEMAFSAFTSKRILMAEDVLVNQFLARVILEAGGFSVDIANNGIEALELLEKNNYSLVLMDVQMPEMDGIMATKKIRQLPDVEKARIPIIALTANALVGNEQEYFDAGMNACLTKPFTEQKLFAAMSSLLNPAIFLSSAKSNDTPAVSVT
ncbi:ATP-binding protein [Parasediminibacterium sp. JCM 36343]|uniref:ATP-binding protein n=1 Tax=Parasediminibacterium sp. JCM 36343 TaxID=3374279 RepID=UPI00397C6B32